jgi:hypothetical protein
VHWQCLQCSRKHAGPKQQKTSRPVVRVISEILVEHTDKWWIEKIIGGFKRDKRSLPKLTICPFHRLLFTECTDNVKTGFDIEGFLLPFPSDKFTRVVRTIGRGRVGGFHEKHSFRTINKHLVCHKFFSKEGKIFVFKWAGNLRGREKKRFNRKEMKEKD